MGVFSKVTRKVKAAILGVMLTIVGCLGSCATTSPYTGPEGDNLVVDVTPYRHWDTATDPLNPHWSRNNIMSVGNASRREVKILVECEQTFMTFYVPARTVQNLLLAPEDESCTVSLDD